jgi:hypothetical protein
MEKMIIITIIQNENTNGRKEIEQNTQIKTGQVPPEWCDPKIFLAKLSQSRI